MTQYTEICGFICKKNWNWKADIRYWLFQLWWEIFKILPAIAKRTYILNEMTWRDYLNLAFSTADMRCGRFWISINDVGSTKVNFTP